MGARVVAVVVLLLSACASPEKQDLTLAALAASNQSRLMQLSVGMTKNDVVSVMGSETEKTRDGIVNNPWTVETMAAICHAQKSAVHAGPQVAYNTGCYQKRSGCRLG